jgi:hypothetical protein
MPRTDALSWQLRNTSEPGLTHLKIEGQPWARPNIKQELNLSWSVKLPWLSRVVICKPIPNV